MRRDERALLRELGLAVLTLQSPEGDWADCDAEAVQEAARHVQELLQSPEGDWADCDIQQSYKGSRRADLGLQSPEGDWADCDDEISALRKDGGIVAVAIPRRGLG